MQTGAIAPPMTPNLTSTQTPWIHSYSEIIDVRSESEFAEDHIPGAINLPVLNDPQREKVGTIYKQVDPFTARKIGAALVAQNIATHLTAHFANKDKNYSPLVYCWRGGQRSHSMATVLSQIGWKVTLLEGGYKTYRAYVREQLAELPRQFSYQVLCGPTGSGKTYLLRSLASRGFQVLDLEALAQHRGSLLGEAWTTALDHPDRPSTPLSQPSQKYFESLLLQQLQHFDPSKPVWVESESNKIGQLYLPPTLWQQMKSASCIAIELPLASRIQWLLHEYPHLMARPERLKRKLQWLTPRYGHKKLNQWYSLIDRHQWEILVTDLLADHYDPTYERSLQHYYPNIAQIIQLPDLSTASFEVFFQAVERGISS